MYKFQALGREDIRRWKIAITGDPKQLAPPGALEKLAAAQAAAAAPAPAPAVDDGI